MAGKLVHVEIGAEDADRAQGFYSGVFGWKVGPPMSPEMDYRMFQTAEDQGGAIFPSDERGNLRVYFDTAPGRCPEPQCSAVSGRVLRPARHRGKWLPRLPRAHPPAAPSCCGRRFSLRLAPGSGSALTPVPGPLELDAFRSPGGREAWRVLPRESWGSGCRAPRWSQIRGRHRPEIPSARCHRRGERRPPARPQARAPGNCGSGPVPAVRPAGSDSPELPATARCHAASWRPRTSDVGPRTPDLRNLPRSEV